MNDNLVENSGFNGVEKDKDRAAVYGKAVDFRSNSPYLVPMEPFEYSNYTNGATTISETVNGFSLNVTCSPLRLPSSSLAAGVW